MEEKKSGGFLKVLLVLILMIACLVGGYFGGNYLVSNYLVKETANKTTDNKVDGDSTNKKEELEVSNRVVQYLYNKIDSGYNSSWYKYWQYDDTHNNKKISPTDDFYVKDASDVVKLQILSLSLDESKRQYIYGDDLAKIPAESNGLRSAEGYASYANKPYAGSQFAYKREYIDTLYKELYGNDLTPSRSVPVYTNVYKINAYVYVEALDMYVLYTGDGGGTTGPGGYTTKITKATKEGTTVEIYEEVTKTEYDNTGSNPQDTKNTVKYTFEQEKDGMYKFISRTKVD